VPGRRSSGGCGRQPKGDGSQTMTGKAHRRRRLAWSVTAATRWGVCTSVADRRRCYLAIAKGIVTGWPGLQARCAQHMEPAPLTAWERFCPRANGRESGQQEISAETHKDHRHWPHHQTVFGEEERIYHSTYEYQQHHRAYESCAIVIHPQPKQSSHAVVSHLLEVPPETSIPMLAK
jgi:hypothetical protein